MGQAKARGTFEARRVEAIVRNNQVAEQRERARIEREARMTPRERALRQEMSILIAVAAGMGINLKEIT